MYKILKNKLLAPNIYLMDVHAPRVASSALPGQFVIVRTGELGERIPFLLHFDREKGTVTIVVQVVGASSRKICSLKEGDGFTDFVGPLGHPSEFVNEDDATLRSKRRLVIAGGVGAAPVYPQVKWLQQRGAQTDVIIGGRSKDFILLEEEMKACGARVHIATDDGSRGYQVDGTGMCGACRVTVGGQTRFTCVDGPEFDAHQVDFDLAMRRSAMYRDTEKERDCRCMEELAAGCK